MTMHESRFFTDEICVYAWGARASLYSNGHIMGVYTKPKHRRKGAASRVLKEITNYADKRGMRLTLAAGAYADQPVSTRKLVKFYGKFGFKVEEGYESLVSKGWDIPMIREPKQYEKDVQ